VGEKALRHGRKIETETEERSRRRRDGELDSTVVEKSTMGIERLDDNGNSILRLPRSGLLFILGDEVKRRRGDKRRLVPRRWPGDDLLPPLQVERKRFIARPASIRRVTAGPFVGSLAFEKLRVASYPPRGKFSEY
jgi:hypothetical protein